MSAALGAAHRGPVAACSPWSQGLSWVDTLPAPVRPLLGLYLCSDPARVQGDSPLEMGPTAPTLEA